MTLSLSSKEISFSVTSLVWPVPYGTLSSEEVVDPLTHQDNNAPLRMQGACLPSYYAWTSQDVDT